MADERYRNSLVLYPVVTSPDFSRPFVNGRPTAFTTNPGQVVGFWSAPRLAGVTLTYRLR